MNLKHLKDSELLSQTKQLVQTERELLTKVLHHLREVERRKLFSDLGYQSLFEYAVKDLKYSEGQAGRRIQAMRLIKEIPELEKKIESGHLSLSNISQAQTYFRESQKASPELKINSSEKLRVLESLENKSAREAQKVLISLQPHTALPRERERVLDDTHTEVRFVMTEDLKNQLEELRSLLGSNGATMSLADLIQQMTKISIRELKIKRFGKKRSQAQTQGETKAQTASIPNGSKNSISSDQSSSCPDHLVPQCISTPKSSRATPTSELRCSKNLRTIPVAVQYEVWNRDQGKCRICGARRHLNFDHIQPAALGGQSGSDNLRLLCFHCNQRQAIKIFGIDRLDRGQQHS